MTSVVSPSRTPHVDTNTAERPKTAPRPPRTFQRTPLATINLAKPLPDFPPRSTIFKPTYSAQSSPSPQPSQPPQQPPQQPVRKSVLREPTHSHRKGLSLDSSVYQEPLYTVDESEPSTSSSTPTPTPHSTPPPPRRRPPRERFPNHPPPIPEVVQEETPEEVRAVTPPPPPPPPRPSGFQRFKNAVKRITFLVRMKLQARRSSSRVPSGSAPSPPHMVEMAPQLARMSFASDRTDGTLMRYIHRREAITERLQASYLRVKGMTISGYEQRGSWVKDDFVCPFPDCEAHHRRPRPPLASPLNPKRPLSDTQISTRHHHHLRSN
ncbi:hypothetical protein FRC03_010531 [Tulasnella sp. 419]|nr:hypothetical protein FRC03_010531 [Tulasnella sp. 419]